MTDYYSDANRPKRFVGSRRTGLMGVSLFGHDRPTLLGRFRALFARPTPADTPLADMFDEPGIDADATVGWAVA